MSWVAALLIVVGVYLAANIVMRRFGFFSSALSDETLKELISRTDEPALLLDVRTPDEYRTGHIPTAVNIPHDSIAARPPKQAKDAVIVLYCQTGSRTHVARSILRRLGFTNVVNFGPLRRWKGELVAGPDPGGPPIASTPRQNGRRAPHSDGR